MRVFRSSLAIVVIVAGFLLPIHSVEIAQAAPLATPSVVAVASVATPTIATPTAAKTLSAATLRRYGAMRYALSKEGGRYVWGGNGPNNYDCSGLVVAAYKHVGISLPRTTQSMLGSGKLIRVSRSKARWGDIVFWGDSHVEMVSSPYRYSFGAHNSRYKIGYRHYYGSPRFYKVKGT